MKKLVFLLVVVLAFNSCQKDNEMLVKKGVSSISSKSNLKSALVTWHNLTQAQRNQAILARAYQNNGQYVGLSCKDWASAVVASASGNATTLPSNAPSPNDWYWNAGQYVNGRSGLLQYAVPGEIVQMRLTTTPPGPHTAIVYSITSTQVTFIECNWCKPATCYTVNMRTITFATFYGQVSNYTIYTIL